MTDAIITKAELLKLYPRQVTETDALTAPVVALNLPARIAEAAAAPSRTDDVQEGLRD